MRQRVRPCARIRVHALQCAPMRLSVRPLLTVDIKGGMASKSSLLSTLFIYALSLDITIILGVDRQSLCNPRNKDRRVLRTSQCLNSHICSCSMLLQYWLDFRFCAFEVWTLKSYMIFLSVPKSSWSTLNVLAILADTSQFGTLFQTFFILLLKQYVCKSYAGWLFTVQCYAECSYATVSLSVTFRYVFHIGWNTLKTISWPNSLRYLLRLTPTWAIWCYGNTPKIGWNIGGVQSTKTCISSETVQDR